MISIETWIKWEIRRWAAAHDPAFLRILEAAE